MEVEEYFVQEPRINMLCSQKNKDFILSVVARSSWTVRLGHV